MQVVYQRCAGLDVHKETVVACVLTTTEGRTHQQVRTFSTMTAALRSLSAWLQTQAVEHVAMESSGVYWWPVFNILEEDGHAVMLVNPQHMKALPGRKTDVADSVWIADLLRHGLLRASFIPPEPIRILRDLTRYRTTLVQERVQEVNRLQKVLESANIKLAAVASDVLGVSGQLMLRALLTEEEPDPEMLAGLAQGRLRAKMGQLRQALEGRVKPHHRVLIARILAHITFLNESVAQVQEEIDHALLPFATAATLLRTIPGVGEIAAATIIAEIGTDMRCFASAAHLGRIWPRGRDSRPAITRAVASAAPPKRPRAIRGCAASWARSPGRPSRRKTRPLGHSSGASPAGRASPKPSSRWRTASLS